MIFLYYQLSARYFLILFISLFFFLQPVFGQEMNGWQVPDLEWAPCESSDEYAIPDMECSILSVPVDWSDFSGPTIDLKLARLKAKNPQSKKGVVLALSGGPGASGIDDLPFVAEAIPEVWEKFDLIAHEPRTALAIRTLPNSCTRSSGAIFSLPKDSLEYQKILQPLVNAIEQCRSENDNNLLDHLDGLAQAMDVEAIRRALEVEELNLTTQSYGGIVVAAYARTFPERIRAAYVDGVASHPDYPFIRGSKTQQENFENFASWCETNKECALYGEDVLGVWLQLTEEANRNPIPGTGKRFGQHNLSGAQLHFMTPRWSNSGNNNEGWIQLSKNIDNARKGDASAFVDWAIGNLMAWATPLDAAMHCPDGPEGYPGFNNFQNRMAHYQKDRPYFYGVKLLGMSCEAWPLPIANPPKPLPANQLPPFLGAGTTDNDFNITAQFLDHIPGSVTIPVQGGGHVVYLGGASESGKECVSKHLTRYLKDLVLPPPGTECEI